MLIVLSLIFLSMYVYVNTLYYSMILLAIVLTSLYILVSNLMLHTLTMIMLAIVYVGAIMILIGYICAVCPNIILVSSFRGTLLFLLPTASIYLLMPTSATLGFNSSFIPLVRYFYSYSGFMVFSTLIVMLFVTLLIVTSQYVTPKGPFRSLTS